MKKSLLFAAILLFIAPNLFATPGDTLKSIPSPGGSSQGLTYDGKYIWCADRMNDYIYKIDPSDGKLLDSLKTPGYAPRGIAFDGKLLWCVDAEEQLVFGINPESEIIEKTIWCPVSRMNDITWDGEYLWIADYGEDNLVQITTEDGTTVNTIKAPSSYPTGLTYGNGYLWVSDRYKDQIYGMTTEGTCVIVLEAPGKHSWGLAWDGENLWNTDYQSDRIFQLVTRDGSFYKRMEEKIEKVEMVHQVRNFGPDTVTTLDIYFAIPQDMNNQELMGQVEFDPRPKEMLTDKSGQMVAHFEYNDLAAGEFTTVKMHADAKLYQTRYFVYPDQVGSLDDIPEDIRRKYIYDDTKFRMDSETIQNAVKKAVGDETNPYWIARNIYDYCIENIEYERVGGWDIAPTILTRGTGSCSEYTFVYMAMCRSAGIPARYVGSIVIRGDDASYDDVYHRWVEVYMPNFGWIPVDPSGGDSEWPSHRANYFGFLNNRFLITTVSAGGSEYMDWGYNVNEKWQAKGRCKIEVEAFGEWSPLETE